MEEQSLITVVRVTWETELVPYKKALEDEGIDVFNADGTHSGVHPLISNALGGIKLKVKKEDYEVAKSIVDKILLESKQKEKLIIKGRSYKKSFGLFCPMCEEEEVFVAEREGFFSACFKQPHYCNACKNTWKDFEAI